MLVDPVGPAVCISAVLGSETSAPKPPAPPDRLTSRDTHPERQRWNPDERPPSSDVNAPSWTHALARSAFRQSPRPCVTAATPRTPPTRPPPSRRSNTRTTPPDPKAIPKAATRDGEFH